MPRSFLVKKIKGDGFQCSGVPAPTYHPLETAYVLPGSRGPPGDNGEWDRGAAGCWEERRGELGPSPTWATRRGARQETPGGDLPGLVRLPGFPRAVRAGQGLGRTKGKWPVEEDKLAAWGFLKRRTEAQGHGRAGLRAGRTEGGPGAMPKLGILCSKLIETEILGYGSLKGLTQSSEIPPPEAPLDLSPGQLRKPREAQRISHAQPKLQAVPQEGGKRMPCLEFSPKKV
ncbi:hypothetical protein P7K49_009496 [Saguinus oedipus]|uniref:Uncharacterized protein n=1 Tax=Saguinus oedipus TaxID=9490 RepID=A0ABQ9VKQ8_SAGOE|nr:hypothetical protein P7K49_009496 [Saguinus oedipus]